APTPPSLPTRRSSDLHAPADLDRVLLEKAQERRRLAGVADARPGAFHRADEAPGEGRHAAGPLQEVQGDALAAEQGAGPPGYRRSEEHTSELQSRFDL